MLATLFQSNWGYLPAVARLRISMLALRTLFEGAGLLENIRLSAADRSASRRVQAVRGRAELDDFLDSVEESVIRAPARHGSTCLAFGKLLAGDEHWVEYRAEKLLLRISTVDGLSWASPDSVDRLLGRFSCAGPTFELRRLTARIGMPLLLLFALILVVRGLTLAPGDPGVVSSPLVGLNFVWAPDLSGLVDPSIWLAAAGQIFFTLSVGMGSIHCYASYLRRNDDIALNAASAGWLNELVEVVLGGSLLIPIATAYLGLQAVQAATAGGGGFGLGFMTLPTLFANWDSLAPVAGALWFGLLFFAGITSSLAMGQPVIAFLEDEMGVRRDRAALGFGLATLLLGGFTVLLYPGGAHAEFDFWSGTVALVAFALGESLIFAWVSAWSGGGRRSLAAPTSGCRASFGSSSST